jgi:hypothetical protein
MTQEDYDKIKPLILAYHKKNLHIEDEAFRRFHNLLRQPGDRREAARGIMRATEKKLYDKEL